MRADVVSYLDRKVTQHAGARRCDTVETQNIRLGLYLRFCGLDVSLGHEMLVVTLVVVQLAHDARCHQLTGSNVLL